MFDNFIIFCQDPGIYTFALRWNFVLLKSGFTASLHRKIADIFALEKSVNLLAWSNELQRAIGPQTWALFPLQSGKTSHNWGTLGMTLN